MEKAPQRNGEEQSEDAEREKRRAPVEAFGEDAAQRSAERDARHLTCGEDRYGA